MKSLISIHFLLTVSFVSAQNLYDKNWFQSEKKPSKKIVADIDFNVESPNNPRPTFPSNIEEWIPKYYKSKKLFSDYSRRCKKLNHENGFTFVNKDVFDAVIIVNRLERDKHMAFCTFYLKPGEKMTFENIPRAKYSYHVELGTDWKECRMDGTQYRMFTKNRRFYNDHYLSDAPPIEPYDVHSSNKFNIYKCNHKTITIENSRESVPYNQYNNIVFNTFKSPK